MDTENRAALDEHEGEAAPREFDWTLRSSHHHRHTHLTFPTVVKWSVFLEVA